MGELIYEEESYAVKGAVFEVYKAMGAGFLEAVYQECLEEELKVRGIPFVAQPEIKIRVVARAFSAAVQLSSGYKDETRFPRKFRTLPRCRNKADSTVVFRVFSVFRGLI